MIIVSVILIAEAFPKSRDEIKIEGIMNTWLYIWKINEKSISINFVLFNVPFSSLV